MNKQFVGLYIEARSIWAVKVSRSSIDPTPRIAAAARYDFLLAPEEINAKTQFYAECIQKVISQVGAKDCELSISFSGSDSLLRYFELPNIPGPEMRSAVGFEAQKHVPFPIKTLHYDYTTYSRGSKAMRGVLFVAVKNEAIDIWTKAAIKAGCHVVFAEPDEMSFFRLTRMIYKNSKKNEIEMHLGLNMDGEMIAIISRGDEILLNHSAAVGLSDVMGIGIKRFSEESLFNQIHRLNSFFLKKYRDSKIACLKIIADHDCVGDEVIPALSAKLGFPAEIKWSDKVFEGAKESKRCLSEILAVVAAGSWPPPTFALKKPINLAANMSEIGEDSTNEHIIWQKEKKTLTKMTAISAVAVVLVVACTHYFLLQKQAPKRQTYQLYQRLVADSGASVDSDVESTVAKLESRYGFMKSLNEDRVFWTDKLSSLSKLTTDPIFLSVLEGSCHRKSGSAEYTRSLRIEGSLVAGSDDMQTLNRWIDSLRKDKAFLKGIKSIELSRVRKAESLRDSNATVFFVDCESV